MSRPATEIRIVKAINCLAIANTTICTTDNGTERLHITRVLFVPTSVTGTPGVTPVVSVGITAAAFVDIVAAAALTAITTNRVQSAALAASDSIAANTAIVLRVSTAGTVYATFTLKVILEGIYD